jgi:hypothetical protein
VVIRIPSSRLLHRGGGFALWAATQWFRIFTLEDHCSFFNMIELLIGTARGLPPTTAIAS